MLRIKTTYKNKVVDFSNAFIDHMKDTEFKSFTVEELSFLMSRNREDLETFIKFMEVHESASSLLRKQDIEEIVDLFKISSVQES
jgi:hypothetical protein